MSLKVRVGTSNDIDALVEVECSDVDTWYHYSHKGRGEPAKYEELTPLERVMHGGPWMDRSELADYWKCMKRLGIIPLVAELDGKVVGHLDVIFANELPLGAFLHLDVLKVHKAYRRRGVARALIQEAERIARDRKVDFMLVIPQEY
ncbi:MAG: GNAT family N-acetyltransferase, partial [Thermofilaceae archaeon]